MESRLTKALRDERIDQFEQSISSDQTKLSEFRQFRKAEAEPKLIDQSRSDVTGY